MKNPPTTSYGWSTALSGAQLHALEGRTGSNRGRFRLLRVVLSHRGPPDQSFSTGRAILRHRTNNNSLHRACFLTQNRQGYQLLHGLLVPYLLRILTSIASKTSSWLQCRKTRMHVEAAAQNGLQPVSFPFPSSWYLWPKPGPVVAFHPLPAFHGFSPALFEVVQYLFR